ncbi:MAG: hypothetical protein IJ617_09930 [Oscillospiraceae bacterium]|nr:hypothetical protein [Oscillospiraceae bacterium]
MDYTAIQNKLRCVPENYLPEIDEFIDFLLFRAEQSQEAPGKPDFSKYYGSIKSLGDGLEIQRKMRDEWN